MKIKDIDLGPRPVFLAPMEDVTDPAFRLMCKHFGADMVYTEFVSADALIRSVGKTQQKLNISDEERPVAIQIYGRDTATMVEAGTLWMQETPRILQGRVFASRSMIARCFVPLSYVVVGPLVDIVLPKLLQSNLGLIINVVGTQALEYRLVFCGAGVLCVLITCCVAANTNFRKL